MYFPYFILVGFFLTTQLLCSYFMSPCLWMSHPIILAPSFLLGFSSSYSSSSGISTSSRDVGARHDDEDDRAHEQGWHLRVRAGGTCKTSGLSGCYNSSGALIGLALILVFVVCKTWDCGKIDQVFRQDSAIVLRTRFLAQLPSRWQPTGARWKALY